MKKPRTRSWALLCSGAVLALACGTASAADAGGSSNFRTIYQQRQPDGTLLLTDRLPYGSDKNVLEQRWTFPVEDPAQAAARRAALRAEHDAVNERLNRLVQQRERLDAEVAIERLRLAGARTELAAEQERSQRFSSPAAVVVPIWPHHAAHPHPHLNRHWPWSPWSPWPFRR